MSGAGLNYFVGRLRMGKAAYTTLFSGWTFGFVWHTWFIIAGRAIRRLSPRNPVPRAYYEFCEATWYSFEALTSCIFSGFYWRTRAGNAGRAIRRLYPRNPVPLASCELCEACFIGIVTFRSGRACYCPPLDGDQSLITEPFYLCRGGACYCSATARALGVFSCRSRSFKAGG